MTELQLSGLTIYPVKSAAGIGLSRAEVVARGLAGDRRWMVVDPQGKFITQRSVPAMALIRVTLGPAALQLAAPGQPNLVLPAALAANGEEVSVAVWGDRCLALAAGSEADDWLSQVLQRPCRLVYMPDQCQRPTAQGQFGGEKLVSFADAYPFLLISEASLAALNQRLEEPVPMDRFRPNLVVRGCDAFAEDRWQRIRIGEVLFELPKGCDRCSIPGVDQRTGIQQREPLLTLAQFRRWDGKIWFGQNLVQCNLGRLSLGDEVEVLSYKPDSIL